jgi:hypothetical protein
MATVREGVTVAEESADLQYYRYKPELGVERAVEVPARSPATAAQRSA